MTVLPIVISGEPVLHEPAAPVTAFDDTLRQLVSDMFETMDEAPGVGLAAPQVGVGLQVFVYDYPEDDGTPRRGVAINPELYISPLEIRDTTDADDEGFPLVRAEKAILRALDLDGKPFVIECDGWFARIMQHEYDHLLGYLYTDRLEYAFNKLASKIERKRGWGKPGHSWLPGVDNLED
jgi:peptide deformylase